MSVVLSFRAPGPGGERQRVQLEGVRGQIAVLSGVSHFAGREADAFPCVHGSLSSPGLWATFVQEHIFISFFSYCMSKGHQAVSDYSWNNQCTSWDFCIMQLYGAFSIILVENWNSCSKSLFNKCLFCSWNLYYLDLSNNGSEVIGLPGVFSNLSWMGFRESSC